MPIDDFVSFVLDQLSRMSGIRHRRMFEATGVYQGDLFFAIVDNGRLYFRTDDSSRPDYESRGMKAFAPTPKMVLKNYFEVPVDVLEDDALLCEWAYRAVAAQAAHKKADKSKRNEKHSPGRRRDR